MEIGTRIAYQIKIISTRYVATHDNKYIHNTFKRYAERINSYDKPPGTYAKSRRQNI